MRTYVPRLEYCSVSVSSCFWNQAALGGSMGMPARKARSQDVDSRV